MARVSPLRVWLIGFGTVGRWVADALDTQAERLAGSWPPLVRRRRGRAGSAAGVRA